MVGLGVTRQSTRNLAQQGFSRRFEDKTAYLGKRRVRGQAPQSFLSCQSVGRPNKRDTIYEHGAATSPARKKISSFEDYIALCL